MMQSSFFPGFPSFWFKSYRHLFLFPYCSCLQMLLDLMSSLNFITKLFTSHSASLPTALNQSRTTLHLWNFRNISPKPNVQNQKPNIHNSRSWHSKIKILCQDNLTFTCLGYTFTFLSSLLTFEVFSGTSESLPPR